jgi:uncharacterized protein with HEPN domain
MRRDELYLSDIIEAADHVAAFIEGADFEAFQKSEMMRNAVVQKLAIIGEAAPISEGLRAGHPEVPWPQIVAFRNILIHVYFGIDWNEVWRAAKNRCPALRQVTAIIAAESAGKSGEAAE